MRSITIPATGQRGHVIVEYDPVFVQVQDGVAEFPQGEALVLSDLHLRHCIIKVPKSALETVYEAHEVDAKDIIDGGDATCKQVTVMAPMTGGRRTIIRVTFHAPFFCPKEEKGKLFPVRKRVH